MSYDESIVLRIKEAITPWESTESKKMFGGVCYLINGNMFCGVYKNFLILRLGEEVANKALKNIHIKPFDITGKPMKGWIMVNERGITSEEELNGWLNQAKAFAENLPRK